MSISLTVNGTTYQYPQPGEDPGWGGSATDWANAVTVVLNSLFGPGDVLETVFSIDNNISVLTNINGLLFDSGTIRAANIEYAIYRTSTSLPSGHSESGKILITYDGNAAAGSKWILSQHINGSSGVTFSITDAGQVQYKSTDMGAGYSGTIKFRAKTLTK